MTEWSTVSRKKNKTRPESQCCILQTFKTTKCANYSPHNRSLCIGWHNDRDRRRDPYKIYYLPEEAMNTVEKAYHPLIYRTRPCPSIKRKKTCVYGNTCAHAHGFVRVNPQYLTPKNLEVFITPPPTTQARPTTTWLCAQTSVSQAINVEMNPFQQFMVTSSLSFWKFLETKTLEFACTVELAFGVYLRIIGRNALEAEDTVRHILDSPPGVYTQKCKFRNNDILLKIGEKLAKEGATCFGYSFVTVSKEYVVVRALNTVSAKSVIKQIKFWVEQEGLDKFVDCSVCYDSVSCHNSLLCPNGHVFCYHEDGCCFAQLVDIALPTLKTQARQQLPCPTCASPFELKTIAGRVAKPLWEKINAAIVDAQVEDQTAKLRAAFDAKLQSKLQEMYSNHGNVESIIQMKGEELATRARNDILNLTCPHCKQPYAEFEGCMALKCESCNENFCGYCHKACKSSRGCHLHVRECDLNITHNHDYYASSAQIVEIQCRYRTKKLKRFLRHGNNVAQQNAAIFELQKDLVDLGIDPGALLLFDDDELLE